MGYTWWTSVFRQRRCASSAIRIEDMNSSASPGPEARHQSPPGRSQVLAVAVVGGLSLLVVVFYQWAVRLMAGTNPALGVPPLGHTRYGLPAPSSRQASYGGISVIRSPYL